MKTDSLFYRLFKEFPGIFFELIGASPETAVNYQFTSVEVKQTAFRIDGVFLPEQGSENPIYFAEVQFQIDKEIYSRLFSEVYLYLHQNKPENDWRGVIVYPTRNLDVGNILHYRESFTSGRVTRIYLDELGEAASLPIGIATIKLVIAEEDAAITQARELINRTQQDISNQVQRRQLLELIETILFYKLPSMTRKEIEAMFGLSDLKKTKVYQEGVEEGGYITNRRAVRRFLAMGLSFEQIAEGLKLSVEEVRKLSQQPDEEDDS